MGYYTRTSGSWYGGDAPQPWTYGTAGANYAPANTRAGAGGGGGGGNPMSDLLNQYNAAYAQARAANEARYAEILGGYTQMLSDALQTMEGMGAQEAKDIAADWGAKTQADLTDLTSRGFAGSTVMPSIKTGGERQKQDALARLRERLRQQRLSVQTGIQGQKLGFMERRTDTYPDMGMYASLAKGLGNAAGPAGPTPSYGGGSGGSWTNNTGFNVGGQLPRATTTGGRFNVSRPPGYKYGAGGTGGDGGAYLPSWFGSVLPGFADASQIPLGGLSGYGGGTDSGFTISRAPAAQPATPQTEPNFDTPTLYADPANNYGSDWWQTPWTRGSY